MAKCEKCGAKIEKGQAFCTSCGAEVSVKERTPIDWKKIAIIAGAAVLYVIVLVALIYLITHFKYNVSFEISFSNR